MAQMPQDRPVSSHGSLAGSLTMSGRSWVAGWVCLLLLASGFDAAPPGHAGSTELHTFQATSGSLLYGEPKFFYYNNSDPNLASLTLDLATGGGDIEMHVFLPNSSVPSQSEPNEWRSQASLKSSIQGTRCTKIVMQGPETLPSRVFSTSGEATGQGALNVGLYHIMLSSRARLYDFHMHDTDKTADTPRSLCNAVQGSLEFLLHASSLSASNGLEAHAHRLSDEFVWQRGQIRLEAVTENTVRIRWPPGAAGVQKGEKGEESKDSGGSGSAIDTSNIIEDQTVTQSSHYECYLIPGAVSSMAEIDMLSAHVLTPEELKDWTGEELFHGRPLNSRDRHRFVLDGVPLRGSGMAPLYRVSPTIVEGLEMTWTGLQPATTYYVVVVEKVNTTLPNDGGSLFTSNVYAPMAAHTHIPKNVLSDNFAFDLLGIPFVLTGSCGFIIACMFGCEE